MEKKKSPASYPHVTQEIRLEEHFEKFRSQLSESWMFKDRAQVNTKESLLDKIEVMIGTGKEYLKKLDDVCSIDTLFPSSGDWTVETIRQRQEKGNSADPEEADELLNVAALTLASAAQQLELKKHHTLYQKRVDQIINLAIPKFAREPNPSALITVPDDFVLIARIFKPYCAMSCHNMSHLISRSQDFLLRGSVDLLSFQDAIMCDSDKYEVFGGRDGSYFEMKTLLSSSMFFFGKTIYVDDLGKFDPADYSSKMEWKVGNMSETLISDLEIRLGYPYVYKHRGECEHNIVFLDARMMMPDDPQELDVYPLVVSYKTPVLCCVSCKTYGAMYMVKDVKIPFIPALLCSSCCKAFYGDNNNGDPNVPDGTVKMPVPFSHEPPRDTVENEERSESDQSTDADESNESD